MEAGDNSSLTERWTVLRSRLCNAFNSVLNAQKGFCEGLVFQQGVKATVHNATMRDVQCHYAMHWAGEPYDTNAFNLKVPPKVLDQFIHLRNPLETDSKSKAAVIYHGTTNEGSPCAWLVAWLAPTQVSNTSPNRVYVKCGRQEDYTYGANNIDWDAIEMRLNQAGTIHSIFDPITKTIVVAEIKSEPETPGRFATLHISFCAVDLLPLADNEVITTE